MTNQFYLTLPSNSKQGNTASVFETDLPLNIRLEGEWEVGLAEISYANTWNNIYEGQNEIKFLDVQNKTRQIIKIPPARYDEIIKLADGINHAMYTVSLSESMEYMRHFLVSYNSNKRCVEIHIETDLVKNVELSPHLMYMLGFTKSQFEGLDYSIKKIRVTAHYPPDMHGGLHYFYIYCDVAQPVVVGNILAPLLQTVNIEGEYMDIINRVYISPHYIPVLKKSFSTIRIEVKNDLNTPIDFEIGKTIVKLHFRKI